jgi:flagellar FliL protein
VQKKPDDDLQDFLDAPEEGGVKAKLDDSELSEELPKGLQKVDLDLDDAPFLMDEEEEAAPVEAKPSAILTEEEPAKAPWWKKKTIVAAAAVVLLAASGATWLLLKKPPPPPPPPPPKETAAYAPQPQEPPPPPPPEELIVDFAPFVLEQQDPNGRPSLLAVKFSFVTTDPMAALMVGNNDKLRLVARDAIYYYLSNKSIVFLTDRKNSDVLKKEVLDVLNGQMSGHEFDRVLIESYVGM